MCFQLQVINEVTWSVLFNVWLYASNWVVDASTTFLHMGKRIQYLKILLARFSVCWRKKVSFCCQFEETTFNDSWVLKVETVRMWPSVIWCKFVYVKFLRNGSIYLPRLCGITFQKTLFHQFLMFKIGNFTSPHKTAHSWHWSKVTCLYCRTEHL